MNLDQVGGGEVADFESGVDGSVPAADEQVTFARTRWANDRQVLLCPNPFQARQVVERGCGDRRSGDVEPVEGLGDREGCGLETVGGVGGIAGSDLGLNQRPQDLLRCPALRLGDLQHLGGVAAHRGQLQPPQRRVKVSSQRCRRGRCHRLGSGGHEAVPSVVLIL